MYGHIHCQECGRVDSTLRHSVFTTVISVFILSHRSQSGGIYCATCRSARGNHAALVSGLFGWWGIPFGIFWTIGALADNLGGGKQDAQVNGALLRALGLQLARNNRLADAREALELSQQINFEPQVEEWIDEIDDEIGLPVKYELPKLAPHSPSLIYPAPSAKKDHAWMSPRNFWIMAGIGGLLALVFIAKSGNSNPSQNRPAPAVAAYRSATSTPTPRPRPTATTFPKRATYRPTTAPSGPTYSNPVTPRAGSGFKDEFSSSGGSTQINISEPGTVQSKFYVDPIAGPFLWSVRLRSIKGNGAACISLTSPEGLTWYYNANPTFGTWSVDRTNATDLVFEWVEPRQLPSSVGASIESLAVRVSNGVPELLIDGVNVSEASGVPLPKLEGGQQPGFCASLSGQMQGPVTVVVESAELIDQ